MSLYVEEESDFQSSSSSSPSLSRAKRSSSEMEDSSPILCCICLQDISFQIVVNVMSFTYTFRAWAKFNGMSTLLSVFNAESRRYPGKGK